MTDPPEPAGVPTDIAEQLTGRTPDELRRIAAYARELAAYEEQEADESPADVETEPVEEDSERPDGVPARASITVKEINDNRYYYWQWRDGDDIKSKYKGPVDDGD